MFDSHARASQTAGHARAFVTLSLPPQSPVASPPKGPHSSRRQPSTRTRAGPVAQSRGGLGRCQIQSQRVPPHQRGGNCWRTPWLHLQDHTPSYLSIRAWLLATRKAARGCYHHTFRLQMLQEDAERDKIVLLNITLLVRRCGLHASGEPNARARLAGAARTSWSSGTGTTEASAESSSS